MRKIILQLFLIIVLLVVFAVTYTIVKSIDHPQTATTENKTPTGFTQDPQFIGAVGGLHFLRMGALTDETSFQRLTLTTQLNRSSTLEETIATPYVSTELVTGDQPYIDIKMSDTTRTNIEATPPEDIYEGINGPAPETAAPVTKVEVLGSTEEGQEIKVYLSDSSKSYRLQSDPQNPSNVWVDILK